MSAIGLIMNLVLAGLLLAALTMGVRLNRRLKALRDSQDGFATAVAELNAAAYRAEQGLADLRAATDEAVDELADRIEKGRALAAKLERLTAQAPDRVRNAPEADDAGRDAERRLGALLAAAREARAKPERLVLEQPKAAPRMPPRPVHDPDADLFEDEPLTLETPFGGRR